jgi:hypothetical protein
MSALWVGVAVPGSPGKFRLKELDDNGSISEHKSSPLKVSINNDDQEDVVNSSDDKENAAINDKGKQSTRPTTHRGHYRFTSRSNSRRANPQIFVRPPSGSSTHTQLLH